MQIIHKIGRNNLSNNMQIRSVAAHPPTRRPADGSSSPSTTACDCPRSSPGAPHRGEEGRYFRMRRCDEKQCVGWRRRRRERGRAYPRRRIPAFLPLGIKSSCVCCGASTRNWNLDFFAYLDFCIYLDYIYLFELLVGRLAGNRRISDTVRRCTSRIRESTVANIETINGWYRWTAS